MSGRLHKWRRAWHVALRITALNFRARMEYRGDFVTALMVGIAWQTSVLVFAGVLLARFPGLGGWNEGGVLLIASIRLLSHGIAVAVFGTLWWTPFLVQEGLLDGYLVRPLPVYRQVLLSQFPLNSLGDSTAAVLLFALTVVKLHMSWTVLKAGYFAAGVAGGVLVQGALETLVASLAFRYTIGLQWFEWVDSVAGTFGNYPLKILPVPARAILTFVFPVAFIAYLPAAVLTGRVAGSGVPAWLAFASPLVALALYVLTRLIWTRALRRYESVGG